MAIAIRKTGANMIRSLAGLSQVILLTCLIVIQVNLPVQGQQGPPTPRLLSIFPAGGSQGQKLQFKIVQQSELEFAEALHFSHPGIQAVSSMRQTSRFFPEPTQIRNQFEVSIGADVPPGVYEVRAQCSYGFSNPRRFVVSDGPEYLESEPNDGFEKSNKVTNGCVVNGQFEAGYDCFQLNVKAGQSLVFHCVAELIDSPADPVIELFDDRMNLLAKNHDSRGKDALVSHRFEKDGMVFVRVNDLTFTSQANTNGAPYRLEISEKPWIDFIEPPLVNLGKVTEVSLYGRNLGGKPSGIKKDGIELEVVEVNIEPEKLLADTRNRFAQTCLPINSFAANRVPYVFRTQKGNANPVVIQLTGKEIIKESNVRKSIETGGSILGVFSRPGELDEYRFDAAKGDDFWIEVVSQRLGLGTDPYLTIDLISTNKDGEKTFRQVATADDLKPMVSPFRLDLDSLDPSLHFVAPADGEYRIQVRDQFNLPSDFNGPNYYQLIFDKPKSHVDLVAISGLERGPNDNHSRPLKITPCIVRANSSAEIQVFAYRSANFSSKIELDVEGLPKGVSSLPSVINENESHGTIVLTGSPELTTGFSRIRIFGRYQSGEEEVRVAAAGAELLSDSIGNELSPSRLVDDLVVICDSSTPFPARIDVDVESVETAVGGVVEFNASLVKDDSHKDPILQAFVHGLPRTVSRTNSTIADSGSKTKYRLDFRQGTKPGHYTSFLRGYFEKNTKRFESRFKELTSVQKRVATESQKVESEYRQVLRDKQKQVNEIAQLKQKLSGFISDQKNLAQQVSRQKSKCEKAALTLFELEKVFSQSSDEIASLKERSDLEQNAAIRAANESKLKSLEGNRSKIATELEKAKVEVDSDKKTLAMMVMKLDELEKTLSGYRQKSEQLNRSMSDFVALEKKLLAERTLGQRVKREIDQSVNLARQAARDRRCRYLVYSKPIQINLLELPIELEMSKTRFSIKQGESIKFQIKATRKFGFDGEINFQLRPLAGANGWTLKNSKLQKGQNEGEFELVIQKYSKPGSFPGEVRISLRNGSANLTHTIPIEVEVQKSN